jgi:hypothetical protein
LKRAQCNPTKYPLVGQEPSQKDKRSIFKENIKIKHVLKYNDILKNTALEHGRIGLVPDLILKFMEVKEDWVRIGVEDSTNQSFLACLSDVFSWKQQKGIDFYLLSDFRNILCEKITLDVFLQLHNASLVNVFSGQKKNINQTNENRNRTEYQNSRFIENLKTMDITEEHKQQFIQYTIQSYTNFLNYLKDETVLIDPTYLWEAVSLPGVLFDRGMNIVIMEMVKNEKNNIRIICPSYPFESVFDPRKDTFFLCKEEENYEPIIKYTKKEDPKTKQIKVSMTKLFPFIDELKNVFGKLTKMNMVLSPSRHLNADKTYQMLQPKYTVYKKVLDWKEKIVGFIVSLTSTLQIKEKFYIPCFPSVSSDLKKLPFQWQDSLEGTDFKNTVDFLRNLSRETKINCVPEFIVVENKMIIGLLTKMNLFIRIKNTPDIHFDETYTFLKKKSTDFIRLDNYLTQNIQKPKSSIYPLEVKKIHLENQFYNTFRTLVRIQMRLVKNKQRTKNMLELVENSSLTNSQKRIKIEALMREMIKEKVAFQEYDDKVLSEYISISSFSKPSMIYTNTGVLLLPVSNLVTGMENNIVYFGRLSDEMVRNRQVQPFMFFPDKYLNISQTEYSIFSNEFLILKPVLNKDYFDKLKRFPFGEYARETTFDTWNP